MSPKEKGHGEGAIRERKTKSGRKYYEGAIQVGTDADGKRLMFYCTGATKGEVRDKFAWALGEQHKGTLVLGARPTLAEFAKDWFDNTHGPLAPITLENYQRTFTKHMAPILGNTQIDKLTPRAIQAFYNRLRKAQVGQPTIRRCHAFLHRLLHDAVRWEYIGRNPADAELVDRPKLPKPKKGSFTPDEARRFVAALRTDPLEALYLLAIANGMRQGEILALHWSDLNWGSGELSVQRSLTRITGEGLREKDPKSEDSERVLPLTEPVLAALRRHRTRQNEARLAAGAAWVDRDLIFCGDRGQPLHRWTMYKNYYLPLLDRAGVPHLTFHELRHSATTLLLHLGVQPHVVQEILGHSDVATTLRNYSHVLPGEKRRALERLGDLLTQNP